MKAKTRKIKLKAVVAILMLLVCIVGGGVFAKYVYRNSGDEVVRAEWFYFNSDLLDGGTHTLAAGTNEISFTLENHADKLRYSEMDIRYGVTVEPSEKIEVTYEYRDIDGNKIDISDNKLPKDQYIDVIVTVKGLENGKTYNVTATGSGGYRKTLTATLEVNDAEPEIYQYLDTTNSEYALLTVWSKGYKGDVKVTYPNTVAPDNTDGLKYMREAKNGEEYITDKETFNSATEDIIGSYTSHVYRFFRTSENANIDGICAYKVLDDEYKIIDTKKPE